MRRQNNKRQVTSINNVAAAAAATTTTTTTTTTNKSMLTQLNDEKNSTSSSSMVSSISAPSSAASSVSSSASAASSTSPSCASPKQRKRNSIRGIVAILKMLITLTILIIIFSKSTVFAAQRDKFNVKNLNTMANSVDNTQKELNTLNNQQLHQHNNASIGASTTNTNDIIKGNIIHANNNGKQRSLLGGAQTKSSTTHHVLIDDASSSSSSSGSVGGGGGGSSGSSTISSVNLGRSSSVLSASSSVYIPKNYNSIGSNSKEMFDDGRSGGSGNSVGPYFEKSASKNVTALLGKTAYLNCRVKNLGNKTMLLQVSWVRHRDIHLLTVGRYTYTSDQRFRAIHQPQTEDWMLQIKYPQHRDTGIYECQVSTTPHMSHYIHLNVVEPSTEIIGAPDLYIESGSTINLTCVILNSPEPPAYIFWNHNSAIINYDSPRGGVSVVTNKGEITTSFLLIKSARPSDSGHYQCNPSNSKSKSVTVHVLNGEFPAAMQRAGQAHHRMSQNYYLLMYLFMYLFCMASIQYYTHLPTAMVMRIGNVGGHIIEWLY